MKSSSSQSLMLKTKEMTRIAFAAAILVCVFWAFSQVLYLELVTTTVIVYGVTFSKRDTFLVTLIFSLVIMLMYGIQSFTIMYLIIFPMLGFITSLLRKPLLKHLYFTAFLGGLFSFLLGTLVDLPKILFAGNTTLMYLLTGLQVGIPKGFATVVILVFAFEPLVNTMNNILKGNYYEE